jgi:hypothetical protein
MDETPALVVPKFDPFVKQADPVGDPRPPEVQRERTLGELCREFVFFTPALILTHGRFDRDPLREFNAQCPTDDEDARPFAIDATGEPFFQGLGQGLLPHHLGDLSPEVVDWDRRLYGIANSRWAECHKFLSGIAIYDSTRYHYARVMYYVLTVVDATALGSSLLTELPTINITVFGVATNRRTVYLAPAVDPPRTRAFPDERPPQDDILREAEAMLGPPPDPEQLAQRMYGAK